ncbi:k-stimulated pyrophosphate-energized sodium pump protein [Anaeramoeba flamelloides]|uniref:K-stimulated pyrophosphate-energized sodium pump protein n=1 Tax=Anaeramoeba flamelloides TaxID=1746091 RepID=A0AAV7YSY1_9EUKA|nr:k-stimulated pyrophosphate-energized sodium pump protein [Anaeramoeba flamelloides]
MIYDNFPTTSQKKFVKEITVDIDNRLRKAFETQGELNINRILEGLLVDISSKISMNVKKQLSLPFFYYHELLSDHYLYSLMEFDNLQKKYRSLSGNGFFSCVFSLLFYKAIFVVEYSPSVFSYFIKGVNRIFWFELETYFEHLFFKPIHDYFFAALSSKDQPILLLEPRAREQIFSIVSRFFPLYRSKLDALKWISLINLREKESMETKSETPFQIYHPKNQKKSDEYMRPEEIFIKQLCELTKIVTSERALIETIQFFEIVKRFKRGIKVEPINNNTNLPNIKKKLSYNKNRLIDSIKIPIQKINKEFEETILQIESTNIIDTNQLKEENLNEKERENEKEGGNGKEKESKKEKEREKERLREKGGLLVKGKNINLNKSDLPNSQLFEKEKTERDSMWIIEEILESGNERLLNLRAFDHNMIEKNEKENKIEKEKEEINFNEKNLIKKKNAKKSKRGMNAFDYSTNEIASQSQPQEKIQEKTKEKSRSGLKSKPESWENYNLSVELQLSKISENTLRSILYSFSYPGAPYYPTRKIRQQARIMLNLLFPSGKNLRTILYSIFRLFHPVYTFKSVTHFLKNNITSFFNTWYNVSSWVIKKYFSIVKNSFSFCFTTIYNLNKNTIVFALNTSCKIWHLSTDWILQNKEKTD